MAIMIDPTTGQGVQMGGVAGLNNPKLGIGSGGMPPGDANVGAGGKGGMFMPPAPQNPSGAPTDQLKAIGSPTPAPVPFNGSNDTSVPVQQPGGGMPGMGGKGGKFGGGQPPVAMPGDFNQYPQPELPPPEPMVNMPQPVPQPIPVGVQQGGTPGRPVPAQPFTPRGPGNVNPGGGGVAPQAPQAPQQPRSILTNPQGQNMPFGGAQNRLQPMMAQPRPMPQQQNFSRAPTNMLTAQNAKRGAGRGGLLR